MDETFQPSESTHVSTLAFADAVMVAMLGSWGGRRDDTSKHKHRKEEVRGRVCKMKVHLVSPRTEQSEEGKEEGGSGRGQHQRL